MSGCSQMTHFSLNGTDQNLNRSVKLTVVMVVSEDELAIETP